MGCAFDTKYKGIKYETKINSFSTDCSALPQKLPNISTGETFQTQKNKTETGLDSLKRRIQENQNGKDEVFVNYQNRTSYDKKHNSKYRLPVNGDSFVKEIKKQDGEPGQNNEENRNSLILIQFEDQEKETDKQVKKEKTDKQVKKGKEEDGKTKDRHKEKQIDSQTRTSSHQKKLQQLPKKQPVAPLPLKIKHIYNTAPSFSSTDQIGPKHIKQFIKGEDLDLRQTFVSSKEGADDVEYKAKRYVVGLSVISEVRSSIMEDREVQGGINRSGRGRSGFGPRPNKNDNICVKKMEQSDLFI